MIFSLVLPSILLYVVRFRKNNTGREVAVVFFNLFVDLRVLVGGG